MTSTILQKKEKNGNHTKFHCFAVQDKRMRRIHKSLKVQPTKLFYVWHMLCEHLNPHSPEFQIREGISLNIFISSNIHV